MRKNKLIRRSLFTATSIMLSLFATAAILGGCGTALKLGSATRQPMTETERTEHIASLEKETKYSYHRSDDEVLYNEDGIIVNSDRTIEVEAWKLKELSDSYTTQNNLDYVLSADALDTIDLDWMTSYVTTKDFKCTVRLYGDSDTMTLDIQLDEEYVGKYILAPQSTILNGIIKDKTLFRAKELDAGHFLITANMSQFNDLGMFGLTMENISSIAWYLTAINTETKEMNSFLIASAFPDDDTWEGLTVSESFSSDSGIIMWLMRDGDYTYLCTFNGSTEKIESDLTVTVEEGDMISDSYRLDVSSGEFTYIQLGFNAKGVTIKTGDTILLQE